MVQSVVYLETSIVNSTKILQKKHKKTKENQNIMQVEHISWKVGKRGRLDIKIRDEFQGKHKVKGKQKRSRLRRLR